MEFRALFFCLLLLFSLCAQAQGIRWQEATIPMPEAGPQGLETLLVWPDTPGKHPVVLLSHGSPRDAKQRSEMTALYYLPVALEFARRGFAVAGVLRRGYGHSGGGWAESYGSCEDTHYLQAAKAGSADLHAAIRYLATQPQFDVNRMLAVGVSAGGFATVALTADSPPKGLVAAISFAGGRGSTTQDSVCQEEALVSAFGDLGKTSRTPMVWIYAQNDHFFSPTLGRKFLQAFNQNGGKATFIEAPAYGEDGHFLFSTAGIPQWTPLVDDFLKSQNLVLVKELLPLPATAPLKPPSQLATQSIKQFTHYLAGPPHKAFAVDAQGAFGWRSGRHSIEEAKKMALEECGKYSQGNCHLYAVDDAYVQ